MGELTTTNPSELKVYTDPGLMGAVSSVGQSDVQVPTLMLMQSNSTFVQESDDISAGDFLHSITRDRWGRKDTNLVKMVIFDMFKTQIVSDATPGSTKKWIETRSWLEDMELDPYEEIVEGRTIRREKCFNYAFFRVEDLREVEKPDGTKGYVASPVVVKLKGGSLKNGKRLNQIFQDYAAFGAPSWATTFLLKATLEEKDGSKYWAYDVMRGEQTTEGEQKAAALLCKQMQNARHSNILNVVDAEEQSEPVQERKVKNYAEDIV